MSLAPAGYYPAPDGSSARWYFDGSQWHAPTPAEPVEDVPDIEEGPPDDTEHVAAIESVLNQFNIDAAVTNVVHGPSVVRYELKLGSGVRVEAISKLHANLAYEVASDSVRILAPIPGKSAIGIELPSKRRRTVKLSDVTLADSHPLTIPIGLSVDGDSVTSNIGAMPHLLVAGATGAGKSCFINAMLMSLIRRSTPEQVRLVLIDPKMVELTPYEGVPHLLGHVATEDYQALGALDVLTKEMDRRYAVMQEHRVRQIDSVGLPYIVVVVDELADLLKSPSGKDIENRIVRLAQKARAAGIHLVLSTQRPSVDVVTGLIKANVPARLAFSTASSVDSRVVLDQNGAEQLLGRGDGLFLAPGARHVTRIQSPFISDREVDSVRKV
jgi:S-DNA-T family DNA segregation ATPase FtsK/SpoIIIE